MLDMLIRGGVYPDFAANRMTEANIGLLDGKIAYLGTDQPAAKEVVDAHGKVVSPGFIDIHMHEEDLKEGDRWVISKMMARQGVTLAVGGNCGVMNQPVKAFKDMIRCLGGCPIHYGLLSGYNYYRHDVLGFGHYEQIQQSQWEQIRKYLAEDLAEGAFGISFGIEYDPGITTEEILYAAGVSPDEHLLLAAHYRADSGQSIASIEEMIRIQEATNKKFQVSHLSSCSAMGQMAQALELLQAEHERNPRFNFDTYPYDAFSTNLGSTVFEDGFLDAYDKDYSSILLTEAPYQNVRCTEAIFRDARARFPEMLAVAFVMNEDEIAAALASPMGMVASDGIVNNGMGHPRAAGTFPRVLGKYVREDGVLDLLTALRKMTLEPAKRLELDHRKGVIRLGADGDLTIFDPAEIADGPVFGDIDRPNRGISCVIVGGVMAVRDNEILTEQAGQFLAFQDR